MIDTHCHLTDPRLHEQLEQVLLRCAQAGVERMITIGTGIEDARACIALCRAHLNIRCAAGIHPNYCAGATDADVEQLRAIQSDPVVVALGEMGLDYHYDRSPPEHQRVIFERQMSLADELGHPAVIHCREAVDDTLAVLRTFPRVPAVFHCFTGTPDEARRILDAGYLLGFTGPITFAKNDELREVVRLTPIDRMLMETDAPYLTPEPMRKIKTNEPSFVVHTARKAAEVKNVAYEELDAATTKTAEMLFGWTGER